MIYIFYPNLGLYYIFFLILSLPLKVHLMKYSLAYYSRFRGLDPRTVQTFVCNCLFVLFFVYYAIMWCRVLSLSRVVSGTK
jgi:hypothetical protein